MRSAQRQLELRRLGNQLPVLGKANSLRKIVKFVFLLVRAVWVKISRDSRVIVARAKSVWRLDDVLKYQLRPLAMGKNTNSRFLCFFDR